MVAYGIPRRVRCAIGRLPGGTSMTTILLHASPAFRAPDLRMRAVNVVDLLMNVESGVVARWRRGAAVGSTLPVPGNRLFNHEHCINRMYM